MQLQAGIRHSSTPSLVRQLLTKVYMADYSLQISTRKNNFWWIQGQTQVFFPKSLINKRLTKTKFELFAANITIIPTYGNIVKTIYIGLKHNFPWTLLIASENSKQHTQHLQELFSKLDNYGIEINPRICVFGLSEVKFLGYGIHKNGTIPLPEKIVTIKKLPKTEKPKGIMPLFRNVQLL